MKKIEDILNSFSVINLTETEGTQLMDRKDTKFTFNTDLLPEILKEIRSNYHCLQIETKKRGNYQNLYYDTADLKLYTQHHNGKLNRYKIRHRTYVDTNEGYLEIKFKNNKGRTLKKRMPGKIPEAAFENEAHNFLAGELPFDPILLKPIVTVNYSRITLINKTSPERLTIDLNIQFKKGNDTVNLDKLVIAEVKQERTGPSQFLNLMRKLHIREVSVSKYCFAVVFTCKGVKKNNFKEKLLALRPVINYDTITNICRSNS